MGTGAVPDRGNLADFPEKELIELAKTDPVAFGELYQRYLDRIYNYVYYRIGNADDAEDLTARTFHQALGSIHRYVDHGAPFAAWLYRIAHNLVANHHRAHGRWKVVSLDELELGSKPADSPDRAAEASEQRPRSGRPSTGSRRIGSGS